MYFLIKNKFKIFTINETTGSRFSQFYNTLFTTVITVK